MWNNLCLTLHFFLIEKLLSGLLQFYKGAAGWSPAMNVLGVVP